jgi:hypothetical protein
MLLRSRMDLSKLSKGFIETQDIALDRIKKLLIKKNFKVELDSDNFYLNSTMDLKFHCLVCDKDFYLSPNMLTYAHAVDCSRHEFTTYIDPEKTQDEKEAEEKRMEVYRKEMEEFPLKSESHEARQLKIYLSKKYSAKLEFRECVNPRTGYFLPYDIYIPAFKVYIEVNGSQHYKLHDKYHKNKEDLEYQKYRDSVKKDHAERNGIFMELKMDDFRKYDDSGLPYPRSSLDMIEYVESFLSKIKHRR